MVNSDKQDTIERLSIPMPRRSVLGRLTVGARMTLVLFGLLLGTAVIVYLSRVNNLRHIARGIRVGDDVLAVDARLGGSMYGYAYGWPRPGARPTHQLALYGGSIDNLHQEFDSLICRVLGGSQTWYTNSFSKHHRAWPVVVEYDDDMRVTMVYIDGIKHTSAPRSRTKP